MSTRAFTAIVVAGLAAVLIGIAVLVVVVGNAQHGTDALPDQIRSITPGPGESMLHQDRVGLRTLPTWNCELRIDGIRIPAEQLEGTSELGECYFRPGADKMIGEFAPGSHRVSATVFSRIDSTQRASYEWTFDSI